MTTDGPAPRRSRAAQATTASAPLVLAALLAGATPAQSATTADTAPGSDTGADTITQDSAAPSASTAPADLPPAPGAAPGWTRGTTSAAVPVSHGGRTYRVRTGDTVYDIARKHGVSVPALVELNDLRTPAAIHPGQVLSLPEKNTTPAAPAGHRVQPGDTLSGIAAKHRTTVAEIQKANAMGDSTVIKVGEVLALSGTGATSNRPKVDDPEDLPALPKEFAGRTYPEEVHRAARVNKKILASRSHPDKAEIRDMVTRTAKKMGVDPHLAAAVAQQESGFQQTVVSPANAIGVMQVIPTSGEWASDLVGRDLNILQAEDNVVAGIAILRWLRANTESESQALAGYYQGLGSVRKNGMYEDTQAYVRNVQVLKDRFARST